MDHEEDPDTRSIGQLEELRRQREATTVTETRTDLPFDEYLNFPEAELARIFAVVRPHLYASHARVPRKAEQDRMTKVVGCVVANAIVAAGDGRDGERVHYSRANTTYACRSPYHPEWLSSWLLKSAIDGLAQADLLFSIVEPPTLVKEDARQSTFGLTQEFSDQLTAIGIGRQSVQRDHDSAPVVFLRKGELRNQKYDPSDAAVAGKIAFLRTYNADLREQHLCLGGEGQPLSASQERQNQLYRRYKNSFEEHGRFYGGWWQGIPAARRQFITINDKRTVELDYASVHPRLLYHSEGHELEGDAYAVPEIMEAAANDGMDRAAVRGVVKQVFGHMLNSKRRGGYQQSDAFIGLPPSISRKEAIKAIARYHHKIAHCFYAGKSLRLMNVDSEVCELVLACGIHDQVTVLPVHDSFIVQKDHEAWLLAVMEEAYAELTGRYPVIA